MTDNKSWVDRVFSVSVNVITDVLSILTLALLVCATGLVAYELYDSLVYWEAGKLRHVAINIFNVLVFIEVLLLFRNFRHGSGVPLLGVIEVSFVLVMREFAVAFLEGKPDPMQLFGIAAILATLSGAWWLIRSRA
ncbi:MAG TPA: phosphate-starvation-inducible PsiE family protein [Steroidobacteraceae bacterium]